MTESYNQLLNLKSVLQEKDKKISQANILAERKES